MARRAQDEAENLRHHAIELLGNFLIELERRERFGKLGILFQRHAMLARDIDDLLTEPAASGRHNARCAILALVVSQRDCESIGSLAHDARSRNWPAAAIRRWGVPRQKATSAMTSESLSAWFSCASFLRSVWTLASRSAHKVTQARPPIRTICA